MPQHLKCLDTVIYDLPLITILVSNCHLFSDVTISQGSVATHLRCGGIFSYHFTANLSPSLKVKEFWKSVKIWQSYRYELGPVFFGTPCILTYIQKLTNSQLNLPHGTKHKKSNEETKNRKPSAQKERSSHKVYEVSPEDKRQSMVGKSCERGRSWAKSEREKMLSTG